MLKLFWSPKSCMLDWKPFLSDHKHQYEQFDYTMKAHLERVVHSDSDSPQVW